MEIGFNTKSRESEVVDLLRLIAEKLNGSNGKEKRLLNLEEAAVWTGFSTGTLYNMSSRKLIPTVRINRKLLFDKHQLDKWISQYSVEARLYKNHR